jgi:hypothetical protein
MIRSLEISEPLDQMTPGPSLRAMAALLQSHMRQGRMGSRGKRRL